MYVCIYIQYYVFVIVTMKTTHPLMTNTLCKVTSFSSIKQTKWRSGSLTAKHTSLSNLGGPSCQLHASIGNIQTPSPWAFTAAKGKSIAKYDIESSIVKSVCFYLFLVYIKRITQLSFSLRLRITFPGYTTLCHYLSSREIWALENKLHSIIYISCQSFPPCRAGEVLRLLSHQGSSLRC